MERGGPYYYSQAVGTRFSPRTLRDRLDDIAEKFRHPEPERVWILREAWDYPIAAMSRSVAPDVEFDEEMERETHGMLSSITAENLRKVADRQKACG